MPLSPCDRAIALANRNLAEPLGSSEWIEVDLRPLD
jgi:hypothetical protein